MLRVHSIFRSIDGEGNQYGQGRPTTFIRLGGCNLRCPYCDTAETQPQDSNKYEHLSANQIMNRVLALEVDKVTITGGEPLLQQHDLLPLCTALVRNGIKITVETNGTILPEMDWAEIGASDAVGFNSPLKVQFVVDRKGPSSAALQITPELQPAWWLAFSGLRRPVFVKYLIGCQDDMDFAERDMTILFDQYDKLWRRNHFLAPTVLVSPVHKHYTPEAVLDWLIKTRLHNRGNVLINVQIHKLIDMP